MYFTKATLLAVFAATFAATTSAQSLFDFGGVDGESLGSDFGGGTGGDWGLDGFFDGSEGKNDNGNNRDDEADVVEDNTGNGNNGNNGNNGSGNNGSGNAQVLNLENVDPVEVSSVTPQVQGATTFSNDLLILGTNSDQKADEDVVALSAYGDDNSGYFRAMWRLINTKIPHGGKQPGLCFPIFYEPKKFCVEDIIITVGLQHDNAQSLFLSLVAPTGKEVTLMYHSGGKSPLLPQMGLTFMDYGGTNADDMPKAAHFMPPMAVASHGSMEEIFGEEAHGYWKICVSDRSKENWNEKVQKKLVYTFMQVYGSKSCGRREMVEERRQRVLAGEDPSEVYEVMKTATLRGANTM